MTWQKALRYLTTLRYLALVISISGCGVWQSVSPTPIDHGQWFAPAFSKALPGMGFTRAVSSGFDGSGVNVLVVDVFDRPDAHGWAVVESLKRAAPGAGIDTLNLFDIDASHPFDPFAASHALAWALNSGAYQIVNLSLTWRRPECDFNADPDTALMAHLIGQLTARGVLVVAAAGNEGGGRPAGFPACLPNVVGVGSVYDRTDFEQMWPANPRISRPACVDRPVLAGMPACFSNRADLYAPGNLSGFLDAPLEKFQGTSASAPLVAAALAVVISAGYQPYQALERIVRSANASHNAPKVDLARALDLQP